MPLPADQALTVAQMRGAEEALVARGIGVEELMRRAGRGAAEWTWRIASGHAVTVLCGPGNNGGDGYVIAEAIRERGGQVTVITAAEPRTDAARNARALYRGEVADPGRDVRGEVFVDCLFGSGLTRPLSDEHAALLRRLAASHRYAIAVDLPSGIESDSGALLGEGLPRFDLTLALGAWKYAHFLTPAASEMGELRLVDIGVDAVRGAAIRLARPRLDMPGADSHKYSRGLLGVVAGGMTGASVLAGIAAQGAGAGYVKLLGEGGMHPCDLVLETAPLAQAVEDKRLNALLIGPGLGRDANALERLVTSLASDIPTVVDADALRLIAPRLLAARAAPLVATPHEGELAALEAAFGCPGSGSKAERAVALAKACGIVIVAKGPDTVIAASDGRLAFSQRASSWLSVAGTGDVLAGVIASRLAAGIEAFDAACQGVWLHGDAARRLPPAFTASGLAAAIPAALADCL